MEGVTASRRLAFAALAIVAAAAFLFLGNWQLDRRAWKHELLARIDARVHAAPAPLPGEADWPGASPARDEYLRVRAQGTLDGASQTLVLASTRLGPGFWVLTPLRQDDGTTVLVNRGFVPADHRERAVLAGPEGGIGARITGLLRMGDSRGLPLRPNDPAADRWSSRDVEAICRRRGISRCAPWFIDAEVVAGAAPMGIGPVPGLTVLDLPDNHLVYSLTWFSLAALSLGGAFAFGRGLRPRSAGAHRPPPRP